jgi:hypothetical protein
MQLCSVGQCCQHELETLEEGHVRKAGTRCQQGRTHMQMQGHLTTVVPAACCICG